MHIFTLFPPCLHTIHFVYSGNPLVQAHLSLEHQLVSEKSQLAYESLQQLMSLWVLISLQGQTYSHVIRSCNLIDIMWLHFGVAPQAKLNHQSQVCGYHQQQGWQLQPSALVMFKGMGTPKGTWVRVQRVRVGVAILKPPPNPDPHHRLGLPT